MIGSQQPKDGIINLQMTHGYHNSTCGYCNAKEKNHWTCGFGSDLILPQDYHEMMDKGWRRCGEYWYSPENNKSCCKMYTIRLEANQHTIRKSHRKVMKKWERFLNGEDFPLKEKSDIQEHGPSNNEAPKNLNNSHISAESQNNFFKSNQHEQLQDQFMQAVQSLAGQKLSAMNQACGIDESAGQSLQFTEKVNKGTKVQVSNNPKKFGDYTANLIMLLFAENKTLLQGKAKNPMELTSKIKDIVLDSIQESLAPIQVNIEPNGFITFKNVPKDQIEPEEKKVDDNIPKPNKKKGNNNADGKIKPEQSNLKPRKFEIKLEKAKLDKEGFEMYKKYCKVIHGKDKEDEAGYENFLCMNTLKFQEIQKDGKTLTMGCYHMKYYVDGKFIAVGVVDITPFCLSSVYFFYDPDYKNLNLGVVGAIKEIEWVKEMNKTFPVFKYYYLGYYIQDCQKMVYKGEYEPAQLLCPTSWTWVPLDEQARNLVDQKAVRLSNQQAKKSQNDDFSETDVEKFVKEKITLIIQNQELRVTMLVKQYQQQFIDTFSDISKALGKRLAQKFVFKWG